MSGGETACKDKTDCLPVLMKHEYLDLEITQSPKQNNLNFYLEYMARNISDETVDFF